MKSLALDVGDLVEVGWHDIALHANAENVAHAETMKAVNVGWVVNVTRGTLRLASGIYPGTAQGDVLCIPAAVVVSVRVIERRRK